MRKPSSAPGAEGNKLKLSGTDKDNVDVYKRQTMRRIRAAAGKGQSAIPERRDAGSWRAVNLQKIMEGCRPMNI